jgi:uncharacterized damage-inducible protein DinB
MDATLLAMQLDFTAWATRRTLESLQPLSEEEFTRDVGASFGSVRGTLGHLLAADWYWAAEISGTEPPYYHEWLDQRGEGATLAMMTEVYRDLTERIEMMADQLRDPETAADFAESPIPAHGSEIPAWQAVMNMVSHATYHRGQLALLLRQLGYTPMGTDLIHFCFEQAGNAWPY